MSKTARSAAARPTCASSSTATGAPAFGGWNDRPRFADGRTRRVTRHWRSRPEIRRVVGADRVRWRRAGKELPLILNFHGGGGHAADQEPRTGMDAVADREGFIVVYPDGTGRRDRLLLTWNAGTCCGYARYENADDVGFVWALLDDLARVTPVDRRRVYATGISNGAMMAYRLGAEAPDRIAAIAPVAGGIVVDPPSTARPVPVMHFHSVDDPRALYGGGLGPPFPLTRRRVEHPPVEKVVARWVAFDGCPETPRVSAPIEGDGPDGKQSATKYVYGPCRQGTEVVLWRLAGAGHVWPGGEPCRLARILGPGTRVIDANTEMWCFFSRFSLPEETAPSHPPGAPAPAR